jgi:hypothetical protein
MGPENGKELAAAQGHELPTFGHCSTAGYGIDSREWLRGLTLGCCEKKGRQEEGKEHSSAAPA